MPANTETEFRLRNLRGRDKRCMYHHVNSPDFEHLNLRPTYKSPRRREGNSKKPKSRYYIPKLAKRAMEKFENHKLCKQLENFNNIQKRKQQNNNSQPDYLYCELSPIFRCTLRCFNNFARFILNDFQIFLPMKTNVISWSKDFILLHYSDKYIYVTPKFWRKFYFNETINFLQHAELLKLIRAKLYWLFNNHPMVSIISQFLNDNEIWFESLHFLVDLNNGWITHKYLQYCVGLHEHKQDFHKELPRDNIFQQNEDYIQHLFF